MLHPLLSRKARERRFSFSYLDEPLFTHRQPSHEGSNLGGWFLEDHIVIV
ncbi:hypothetical protein NC651_001944 [Populus alba x Populus x berolinensis]|nr:hypothetical protein NC651_001944 [Populus alba x Populus x berolinensis]